MSKLVFKITQLRYFVLVAELKSFHAAAEKAHRSQPAVSLAIKELEGKLGHMLFEKTNSNGRSSSILLTEFGQYFLPRAKSLVENHDRMAADIKLLTTHQAGHMRLACVPSIALRFLPNLLHDFLGSSCLHVSIFDDNSEGVLDMIAQNKVDFGITSTPPAALDVEFIPIWQDEIGVVCHRDYPISEQHGASWQELQEYKYICNGTSRLLEIGPSKSLLKNAQFYMSNLISLVAMLEAKVGITTLPFYALPENHDNLKFVKLVDPQIKRTIGITSLKGKSLTPSSLAFIEFIKKAYQKL